MLRQAILRTVRQRFSASVVSGSVARIGAAAVPAGARSFATASAEAGTNVRPYVAGVAAAAGLTAAASALAAPALASEPKSDIKDVVAAITAIIDEDESRGPLFVRLAWHASGTYDKASGTGGSNGASMRFPPESDMGANAGLHIARALLEPVKEQFPDMSYGDIWTLAGKTAVEVAGGPEIPWEAGRTDLKDVFSPNYDGRLPDADKGELAATVQHVRDIFYRMGFNDREIVALLGAHALGRCHTDRSGYTGPWTRAETSFSNEYYLENTWTLKKWKGPTQFEDPTGDLMMLPSDMALIWDKDFLKVTQEYAKDSDKFFKDFAAAFGKLLANGVNPKPWYQFW